MPRADTIGLWLYDHFNVPYNKSLEPWAQAVASGAVRNKCDECGSHTFIRKVDFPAHEPEGNFHGSHKALA